jgi:hypothetical protein
MLPSLVCIMSSGIGIKVTPQAELAKWTTHVLQSLSRVSVDHRQGDHMLCCWARLWLLSGLVSVSTQGSIH